VHNVSQWPNLRHLAKPLGAAVGLLEAVIFKERWKVSAEVELRMLEGSEFQTVAAAMLKRQRANVVPTRGTDSILVLAECREHAGV